jgi:leucyl-tRNA synthetase
VSQPLDKKTLSLVHKTIKKVGEDIENFHLNTAVSALMILVNELGKFKIGKTEGSLLLQILAPFAPHLSEELWEKLGNKTSIFKSVWPQYDPRLIRDETVNLVVQVNGKLRATIEVAAEISEKEAMRLAQENMVIKKWLDGKKIIKNIFVPGKLLNIVVK